MNNVAVAVDVQIFSIGKVSTVFPESLNSFIIVTAKNSIYNYCEYVLNFITLYNK